MIATTALALAIVAFGFHPVGDYYTESDFYAGYALGADLLRHGQFDFGRYGVYGPGYEVALAVVGLATGDLFVAARLLSVAAAVLYLWLSWRVVDRLAGATAGFWLTVLVAANPTFFRYGYSVGTDMPANAWWMAAVAALVLRRDLGGWAWGGLLAALAVLTRYNLASVVPGALAAVFLLRTGARDRWASAAVFLGVFLLAVAPFTIGSLLAGYVPGRTLLGDAGYYISDTPGTVLEERYTPGAASTSPVTGLTATIVRRLLTGIPVNLLSDGVLLLGWPVALLALAGAIAMFRSRGARPLLALAPFGLFTFLALAPVYYAERYSLPLLSLYLAPAASLLGGAMREGRAWVRRAAVAAGGLAAMFMLFASVEAQRAVRASLPDEALESGRALNATAHRGERILARKGHVAYEAGLDLTFFPDVASLDSLAAFCRAHDVQYLYYSWLEFGLRPKFGYLIDTTATVPGLTPIHATHGKPSVTYRIGPEFGRTPEWWNRADARQRIAARVNTLMRNQGEWDAGATATWSPSLRPRVSL